MSEPNATTDVRAKNLALWEGLAALHGGGLEGYEYYDVDALVAGRNPIQAEVDDTLDVALAGRASPDSTCSTSSRTSASTRSSSPAVART